MEINKQERKIKEGEEREKQKKGHNVNSTIPFCLGGHKSSKEIAPSMTHYVIEMRYCAVSTNKSWSDRPVGI